MELNQFDLIARDVDATIGFYRRLGIRIPRQAIWRSRSGTHHVTVHFPNGVELAFGSPALARAYNRGYRRNTGGGNIVIGFSVATRRAVDAAYKRMTAAGHAGLTPPFDAFWGARYAILADPDGNHVGIMSPSDPARRSPGPAL